MSLEKVGGFHTDSRDRVKPVFATLWLLFQKPLFSNNNKTVLSNTELCSSEIPFKELSCFWKFFVVVGSRNAMTMLQKWQQVPNNLHLRTMIESSPSGHFVNMVNVIHFTCGFNVVSSWWKEKTKTNFQRLQWRISAWLVGWSKPIACCGFLCKISFTKFHRC